MAEQSPDEAPATPGQPPAQQQAAEQPPAPPAQEPPPAPRPYGPGVLMFFGLALLAFSGYCFYDLYLGEKGREWEAGGETFTIWLNRVAMVGALIAAIYALVLAYLRWRKAGG
ncbi:MAG: hypothetical protein FJ288_00170 [Planctomycetes bacterium]|nr:hypothetical protein [Planctomycetota bacterium]